MESERANSIWPHAQAIITNPSVWRWAYRVLLPMALSFGIKPALEQWRQLSAERVRINRNVEKLLSAAVAAKNRADREATMWRTEARLAARARVELVAAQKKQVVSVVLTDYDQLVARWAHQDPACLTEVHCPSPSEAADMALAVRRPR